MTKKPLVHFHKRLSNGFYKLACKAGSHNIPATTNINKVTCKNCLVQSSLGWGRLEPTIALQKKARNRMMNECPSLLHSSVKIPFMVLKSVKNDYKWVDENGKPLDKYNKSR